MFFFRENRLPLFFTLILLAFIVAKAYNYVQDHNKAQAATARPPVESQEQVAQEIVAEAPATETAVTVPAQREGVRAPEANPIEPDSPDVPLPDYKDPALEPTEKLPPMPDTVNPAALGDAGP